MRSVKWCRFQWPWMNTNPVFKVIPLFDAKYLTDGYRYGNSYYARRIGNRIQACEWHRFQWPWVTFKPDFKVTVLFNVAIAKFLLWLRLCWIPFRRQCSQLYSHAHTTGTFVFMGLKFQVMGFYSQNLGEHRPDPEKTHPCVERRVWAVVGPDRTRRVYTLAFHTCENYGKVGGPVQLSHQTSQETLHLQHGIAGSIVHSNQWAARLGTGRYVSGILYGKNRQNLKIGQTGGPVAPKSYVRQKVTGVGKLRSSL